MHSSAEGPACSIAVGNLVHNAGQFISGQLEAIACSTLCLEAWWGVGMTLDWLPSNDGLSRAEWGRRSCAKKSPLRRSPSTLRFIILSLKLPSILAFSGLPKEIMIEIGETLDKQQDIHALIRVGQRFFIFFED